MDATNTVLEGVVVKLCIKTGSAWACDVVDALRAEGYDITREEFATWALEAHSHHIITLRRQDLVSPKWASKMNASEIKGMAGSTYHTIEA